MSKILVVDGQGGGVGRQLISAIKATMPNAQITAVGTNSIATQAMLKAGADEAATGENALIVACRRAKYILGPIGIVIADSLMGEISPKMAAAVGQSEAMRILVPSNRCGSYIVGLQEQNIALLVEKAVQALKESTAY
ncbi:MAG: DUF3842 family protein [Eubacteriales bacterium]|nr:DUF3842 family protein [Eubacteriales bacterium]